MPLFKAIKCFPENDIQKCRVPQRCQAFLFVDFLAQLIGSLDVILRALADISGSVEIQRYGGTFLVFAIHPTTPHKLCVVVVHTCVDH